MSRKKGSPLDSLQRRALPKLEEVSAARQNNGAPTQPHGGATPKQELMRSSNVTLPNATWDWIDDRHREIQRSGWHSVRKAAVIRAVFAVVMSVKVDLTGVVTEEEIAQRLDRAMQQLRS